MTPLHHHEIVLQGSPPVFSALYRGLQAEADPRRIELCVIGQGAVEGGLQCRVLVGNRKRANRCPGQGILPVALATEKAAPLFAVDEKARCIDATDSLNLSVATLSFTESRAGIRVGPADVIPVVHVKRQRDKRCE